jgi:hypothetical protein
VSSLTRIQNVADHHLRALGGERIRIVPADAPRSAGDDGGPIT